MTARAILASALCLLAASTARADLRAYRGAHPIDLDGHWHLADEAHVHDELAVGLEPFGDVDGVLVFLADPLAFGWSGDVWTFDGAHPLPGGMAGYCGIAGEHRHAFAPEGAFRREDDGSYVYTGALRGGLAMVRPGRVAPRHPIVTTTAPARASVPTGAPYWYGGFLHRLVGGPRGPEGVPVGGCVVRVPPSARPTPPPAAAPPPRSRAWIDNGYRTPRPRDAASPERVDRPRTRQ